MSGSRWGTRGGQMRQVDVPKPRSPGTESLGQQILQNLAGHAFRGIPVVRQFLPNELRDRDAGTPQNRCFACRRNRTGIVGVDPDVASAIDASNNDCRSPLQQGAQCQADTIRRVRMDNEHVSKVRLASPLDEHRACRRRRAVSRTAPLDSGSHDDHLNQAPQRPIKRTESRRVDPVIVRDCARSHVIRRPFPSPRRACPDSP